MLSFFIGRINYFLYATCLSGAGVRCENHFLHMTFHESCFCGAAVLFSWHCVWHFVFLLKLLNLILNINVTFSTRLQSVSIQHGWHFPGTRTQRVTLFIAFGLRCVNLLCTTYLTARMCYCYYNSTVLLCTRFWLARRCLICCNSRSDSSSGCKSKR